MAVIMLITDILDATPPLSLTDPTTEAHKGQNGSISEFKMGTSGHWLQNHWDMS